MLFRQAFLSAQNDTFNGWFLFLVLQYIKQRRSLPYEKKKKKKTEKDHA